jgi:predicted HAD superfamily Cof-like phosphohydrolase
MLDSEVAELKQSWMRGELAAVERELADIVYTCYGLALELGLNLDVKLAEVHESNMTRKSARGGVQRRADGKIQKGRDYLPPPDIAR